MPISINNEADWNSLPRDGLTNVVDPLVLRCGELFLKGRASAQKPHEVWDLLLWNVQAVGLFVDTLVMQEKIPVFNYPDTFDKGPDFQNTSFPFINSHEHVLFDVDIAHTEYIKVKDAALHELYKIYDNNEPARIQHSTIKNIVQELSFSGYQWNPSIGKLEDELDNPNEKQLARYLLAGLIFGGYAQVMGTEHLVQPKRSRIYAALALGASSTGHQMEEVLFRELKEYAGGSMVEVPWVPSFFPYLVDKANNTQGLLNEIMKLRRSPAVKDYRAWWQELLSEWREKGKISLKNQKDIKKIKRAVQNILEPNATSADVELKINFLELGLGKIPFPEINLSKPIQHLWGLILDSLPGKRYRKLLTRMIIKDKEYYKMDMAMHNLWTKS